MNARRYPRPFALALGALVVVLAVVASRVLIHAGTDYDTEFHLAWGRDVLHGHLPGFARTPAPTEHPLFIVAGALADLVPGIDAEQAIHAVIWLCLGTVIVLVLLLGAELFSWAAGAVSAAALVVNSVLVTTASSAGKDLLSTVLVLMAILLAVREPRRAVAPLVLLALAGLMRPEAWGLAGVYWLWQLPRRTARERIGLGFLAIAAQVIWLGLDLLVAGDPLYSFRLTGRYVEPKKTGLGEGTRELWHFLNLDLGHGLLYGGLAGMVGAAFLHWRREIAPETRRISGAIRFPIAALVFSSAWFVVLGAGELPLYERFLLVPTSLLALFFGFAVTAAWHLGRRPIMTAVAVAGIAAVVSAALYVPDQINRTREVLPFLRLHYRATNGLKRLVATRAAHRIVDRCPIVAVTPYILRPYLANYLRREPRSIWTMFPPPHRVAVFAPAAQEVQDILLLFQRSPLRPIFHTPPDYRRVTANNAWRAIARGC